MTTTTTDPRADRARFICPAAKPQPCSGDTFVGMVESMQHRA